MAWLGRELSLLGVPFTVGEAILTALLLPPAVVCGWLFVLTYLAFWTPVR